MDTLIATNRAVFTFNGGTLNTYGDSSILVTNTGSNLPLNNGSDWNVLGGTNIVRLAAFSRTIQFNSGSYITVSGTGTVFDATFAQVGANSGSTDDGLRVQNGAVVKLFALSVGTNANIFGAAQNVFGSGLVVVTNGGVLQANQIATGLGGKGTVTVANATVEFTTNTPNIDLKTAGTFTLSAGTVSFRGVTNANFATSKLTNVVFSGNNTLSLNHASNSLVASYTFKTNNGQNFAFLNLANGGMFRGTSVTVDSGGRITGDGLVSGAVDVKAGGALSPGNNFGTLTIGTGLTMESNSLLQLEISSTQYDQIVVLGGVSLSNSILQLTPTTNITTGTYVIVDNDGTGDLTLGMFQGLTNNAFIDASANGFDAYFRVQYNVGDGNNVVLFGTIPEPSSILLYGVFLAMGMALRRRIRTP